MNFKPVLDLIKGVPSDVRHAWMKRTIDANLAAQIRAMREVKGWTQAELGEVMGMGQSYVAKLETAKGVGHASVSTLIKIAAAFDVALQVKFCSWGEWINLYITPYGAYTQDGLCAAQIAPLPLSEDMAFLEGVCGSHPPSSHGRKQRE